MIRISRDTPCYYLTSVAKDRLPVFRTDTIGQIVCNALDEARKSANLLIFAYVLMPDHLHIITDGAKNARHSLKCFREESFRKGTAFPHIGGQSPKKMLLRQVNN